MECCQELVQCWSRGGRSGCERVALCRFVGGLRSYMEEDGFWTQHIRRGEEIGGRERRGRSREMKRNLWGPMNWKGAQRSLKMGSVSMFFPSI